MAIIVRPYVAFPGDVIRSSQYNQNFDTVYNDYNGNIDDTNVAPAAGIQYSKLQTLPSAQIIVGSAGNVSTRVPMTGDVSISNTGVTTIVNLPAGLKNLTPVGSIIPFYDFNGAATFDPAFWAYCAGQTITVGTIGMQTLPDLSNRYLVGFGTEGGQDIGTAPWSATPVGNANHQINLAHSHTVNSHTHGLATHIHGAGGHTHPAGNLQFKVAETGANLGKGNTFLMYDVTGTQHVIMSFGTDLGGSLTPIMEQGDNTMRSYYTLSGGIGTTAAGGGDTAGPSPNISDATAPGTNSQLSATTSIQPRSIRVRFIMRIK